MTFAQTWAAYRAAVLAYEVSPSSPWFDDARQHWSKRLRSALLAEWHDVEPPSRPGGASHPVLWYDAVRPYRWQGVAGMHAVTEPCIYCGRVHWHGADADGDGDGHRSPHCGPPHSHDLTPTGNRRKVPWTHRPPTKSGAIACPDCGDAGYILRRRPVAP